MTIPCPPSPLLTSFQVERARLEAEYQQKLMGLTMELERLREELGYRTLVMNEEMERYSMCFRGSSKAQLRVAGCGRDE